MVRLTNEQKPFFYFGGIALLIICLDQLTKYLISQSVPEWKFAFVSFHFIKNTGAGFGILQDHTSGLALISLLVASAIIVYYKKIPAEKISQALFAVFFGGVVGNFIDRAFRGYVIDFIDLAFWPAFNIADAAITISGIGMIIYFWKKEEEKQKA